MRYYCLKSDLEYRDAPQIIDWQSLIDIRELRAGHYGRLPERFLLRVRDNPDIIFTDAILAPFFLVSKAWKECLLLFEPNLYFKEIILLDQIQQEAKEYFLPQLAKVSCLTGRSTFNMNRSQVTYMELDEEQIGDKSIFTLAGVESSDVIARLDVVEGLLRRGCQGILLTEVDCRKGEKLDG